MGYRRNADPELARLISDRLALVLADRPARRARDPGLVEPAEAAEFPAESVLSGADQEGGRRADQWADDLLADDLLADDPLADDPVADDPVADELPRPRFGRMHVGVICALLSLGLLTAGWLLLRARPVAIASPADVVTAAAPAQTAVSATPSAAKSAAKIVVHVLGAVRDPGLVKLPENSRVQDAISAAGGLTRQADPGELNLAQVLSDGQQVMIGTAHDPAGEVREQQGSATGGGSAATGALDLNRASQSQLEELPGVGPVIAQTILGWREQHGRFTRIEELQEVDGIGPKTYAQIAPHVRV
jgi:competence protein ComEA